MALGFLLHLLIGSYGVAAFASIAIVAGLVLANAPTHVIVGHDGLLTTWLGWSRFIAHRDISSVLVADRTFNAIHHRAIVLALRSGTTVLLAAPMGRRAMVESLGKDLRCACSELSRDGAAIPPAMARLAQDGVGESLYGALEPPSFRSDAIDRAQAWQVLENAVARPLERIAAIMVLLESLTEDERRRLGVVADATVNPKIRAAFAAAAQFDRVRLTALLKAVKKGG